MHASTGKAEPQRPVPAPRKRQPSVAKPRQLLVPMPAPRLLPPSLEAVAASSGAVAVSPAAISSRSGEAVSSGFVKAVSRVPIEPDSPGSAEACSPSRVAVSSQSVAGP